MTDTARLLRRRFREEAEPDGLLMHRSLATGVSRHEPVGDLAAPPGMSESGVALSQAGASRGLQLPGRTLADGSAPLVDLVVANAQVALKMPLCGATGGSMAATDRARANLELELSATRSAVRDGTGTTDAAMRLPGGVPSSRSAVAGARAREEAIRAEQAALAGGLHAYGVEVSRRTMREAAEHGTRPPTPTRPGTAGPRWWDDRFPSQAGLKGVGAEFARTAAPRPRAPVPPSRRTARALVERLKRSPSAVELAFDADTLEDGDVAAEAKAIIEEREETELRIARQVMEGREPSAGARKQRRRKRRGGNAPGRGSFRRAVQSAGQLEEHRHMSLSLPVNPLTRDVVLSRLPGGAAIPAPAVPARRRTVL